MDVAHELQSGRGMKKNLKPRKLQLDIENLRLLSSSELGKVAGGMINNSGASCEDCPGSVNGCLPSDACGTLLTVGCNGKIVF